MHHFLINDDLHQKHLTIDAPELLHQLNKVLRFRVGDHLTLIDGRGNSAHAQIISLHKRGAEFELATPATHPPYDYELHLYLGVPKKPSTFEWILQKATELGVTHIHPVSTERTQIGQLKKSDRNQAIIKEAVEQSERFYLPEFYELMPLKEALKPSATDLVLAGDARYTSAQPLTSFPSQKITHLVIGPEGGLTDFELKHIESLGGHVFCLGSFVLRVETAVISSISLLRYQ